jgi:hypothetical protein
MLPELYLTRSRDWCLHLKTACLPRDRALRVLSSVQHCPYGSLVGARGELKCFFEGEGPLLFSGTRRFSPLSCLAPIVLPYFCCRLSYPD